jgi:predicted NBD/HSP70 family sugar kinase
MVTSRDDIGLRSETVRRANLSSIVRALHDRGPLSRSDLVVWTGLTRSAIRSLIGQLVVAGLAAEERAAPQGTPGRPSPLVRLNPDAAVVLALDIGIDSLAVAIVGLGGTVFELDRVDRPRGHSSVDDIAADLVELATAARSRRPDDDPLLGIGVAIAGVVRRSDGVVSMAPNLGWKDVPLCDRLAEALGASVPIAVANDADLGVLAEHRLGVAVGSDDVLFVSGEVGVGGGFIVDGRPLTGVDGYGGEIGHMPVRPDGATCSCGSFGCWETEIGEPAVLARAGHPVEGGRSEVEKVLAEAAAGSAPVLAAFAETGRWLGIGLAGIVNIFNPRLIVLGGLLGRIYPYVIRTLNEVLDRRALPASRALVRVVPASLGVDAPLLGAAEMAFEPLLADPATWIGTRHGLAQLASA